MIQSKPSILTAGILSAITVAGCEPSAAADPFSAEARECADVSAILAASEAATPFEALRAEPETFPSGAVIDGSWVTPATLDGHACTLSELSGFFGRGAPIQVLRCTLNANAMFEDAARDQFAEADDYLRQCLPETDWTRIDKSEPGEPGLSAIYERESDRERQAGSDMYIYPIQVEYKVPRNGFGTRHRSNPSVSVAFQFTNAADAETTPPD